MTSVIRYTIINGSRSGLFVSVASQLKMDTDRVYIIDIPEETLWKLREKYPGTNAMYLYDPKDLVGKSIHDIGPIIGLYNTFIAVDDKQ
jgi:hypothetical protein